MLSVTNGKNIYIYKESESTFIFLFWWYSFLALSSDLNDPHIFNYLLDLKLLIAGPLWNGTKVRFSDFQIFGHDKIQSFLKNPPLTFLVEIEKNIYELLCPFRHLIKKKLFLANQVEFSNLRKIRIWRSILFSDPPKVNMKMVSIYSEWMMVNLPVPHRCILLCFVGGSAAQMFIWVM